MNHNNIPIVGTEIGLSNVSMLVSHRFNSSFSSVLVIAVASTGRVCVFNDSKAL